MKVFVWLEGLNEKHLVSIRNYPLWREKLSLKKSKQLTIKFKKSPVPTNVFFQSKKTEMCFFLTIRTGPENYFQHYW